MQETLERLIMQANGAGFDLRTLLMAVRRQYIADALTRCNGNQCTAAKALGIHRNTLTRQMYELDIRRARNGQKTT